MTWAESQKLMLQRESEYLASLPDDLSADVVAVMVGLYRGVWRDCWIEENSK